MKPFSSHATQIQILKERGLLIKDEKFAQRILSKENYYSVINGYKKPFIRRDKKQLPEVPEKYTSGTTFEDIHKLFLFDRQLRSILLKELLKFENNIKAKIAYRFSEKFQEPDAYLKYENFSDNRKVIANRNKLIFTMDSLLKHNIDREKVNHPAIKHYHDNYHNVPLWVLVNFLTLGNISYFYQVIDESLRNTIARDFAEEFNDEYFSIRLTTQNIENIIKVANFHRNICAHEEILYSFGLKKPISTTGLDKILNMPGGLLNKGNVFSVISLLKIFLSKSEHDALIKELDALASDLKKSMSSEPLQFIEKALGLTEGWERYFPYSKKQLNKIDDK